MLSPNNARLDYLDAVRAFALILGVVFHACLSFIPIFIGWAVMDVSTSSMVSIFALVSHSFRMELFFLIAGFFGHMKFHQLGVKAFFKSRLVRIAIPFFLGWFLLRPLLVSGWMMGGESMRGEVNIIAALKNSFAGLGDLSNSFLVGTHLWFLYYLLLISASVVLLGYLLGLNKTVKRFLTSLADSVVLWLCHSRIALVIVAIPTAFLLWFMDYWGMDTPDKSLIPHIPVALLYGSFFLFGWLMHRQTALIEQFARITWSKILLSIASIIAAITLSQYEANLAHPHYLLLKMGFKLSYAIMMWSLVMLTIGVCKHLIKRESKTMRYLADASYWLYLIHLPIVIWLQITFAELPLPWAIKLISICVITITISLVLYDIFVRSTFIGKALNGKQKTRVLFNKLNTPEPN